MPCVYLPGPAPAVTVANSHTQNKVFHGDKMSQNGKKEHKIHQVTML